MADVITRFKLETTQYDSKLRDASKGLADITRQATLANNEFGKYTQKSVEAARSLGNIATSATNSKDKVKELVGAFNDVAKAYNALTKEQQQSDFGKALAESMNTLKGRIAEAKQEMNSTGGILDQLQNKFTVNIDAVKIFSLGLQGAKAALDVAKDAFFASETNVDEWGQTVAAAESIYDSFLQSLNTGDFSGFLNRLSEVINKAKEAYNALDDLQTRMTIINPERTRLQARATELKATIRRQGADSESGRAAQAELRQIEGMLTQAFKTESQMNMNVFKTEVDKKLQDAGIKLGKKDYDFLMRTFSSDASYMAMKRGAKGSVGRDYDVSTGDTWTVDNRNLNQKLLDLFTDEWRREYSPYLNAAFSARGAAASNMLSDARYLKEVGSGGRGSSGGGGGGIDINALLRDSWSKASMVGGEKAVEMTGPSQAFQAYVASIKRGSEEASNSLQSLIDAFEALNKAEGESPSKEVARDGKVIKGSYTDAASAVGSLGSALSGLDDPGAKIAGTIAQAIANIALAFSSADLKEGQSGNIWYWIAATAAGMATMISTIASIHSATGYAQGGMIKGNSYSGDNIGGIVDGNQFVGLNAGEVVLTRAMQGNLASQLNAQSSGGGYMPSHISGEQIYIALNRYVRRSGRGEIVTWKS